MSCRLLKVHFAKEKFHSAKKFEFGTPIWGNLAWAGRLAFRLLFVLFVTVPQVSFAGQAAGDAAFNAKDYATALSEWRPLADKGEPVAQYDFGLLYARGFSVESDDAVAVE